MYPVNTGQLILYIEFENDSCLVVKEWFLSQKRGNNNLARKKEYILDSGFDYRHQMYAFRFRIFGIFYWNSTQSC